MATKKTQRFVAGFAPATDGTAESYWRNCTACSRAGFHLIETSNTRLQLPQTYLNRTSEFRDQMAKLNLRLLGLNQNHSFLDPTQATDIREKNTVLGRFLKAVGATYIGWEGIIVPAEESGGQESEEDLRRIARLANEEGKRLWEEDGLKFTYHPQSTAGLGRLLDLTNPAYVHLNPDLGWLAARGGADALQICQAYLSRIVAIHLKDYDPNLEFEYQGKHQKGGTVLPGSGVIKFPALVDFLKEAEFEGCLMGEYIGLGTFDFARSPEGVSVIPVYKEYMVVRLGLQI